MQIEERGGQSRKQNRPNKPQKFESDKEKHDDSCNAGENRKLDWNGFEQRRNETKNV